MAAAGEREHYLSQFEKLAGATGPAWLRSIREAAISRFAEIGFPTPREEDWKYTNVLPVVKTPFRPAPELATNGAVLRVIADLAGETAKGSRLVFVNGLFSEALSSVDRLPEGVRVESLAQAAAKGDEVVERHLARHARYDQNGFTALSTAFLHDGALVIVPQGKVVDEPIEILFVSSAGKGEIVAHPRTLVVCGQGSQAALVELYASAANGSSLTNAVVEVVLGDGSRLEHLKLLREGDQAAHVATTEVAQGRDSVYKSSSIALGAAFARNNLNVTLEAEGAECSLDGLYMPGGEQFIDNHTSIDHRVPHGTSRELYKGVLGGKSRAVFNGKVIVRPGAQKTDAQQTNKNLLLSERAEVDTKPELQIHADDVKCAHGAAIGQLDPEALFYLKSRGFGEAAGRKLLTTGFVNEVIGRIGIASVLPILERLVGARLEREIGTA